MRASGRDHRQQATVDQPHPAGREPGARKGANGVVQQGRDVIRSAVRGVGVAVVHVVTGADDRYVAPWHDEQEPSVDHAATGVRRRHAVDDQVHGPRQPRRRHVDRCAHEPRQDRAGPRAGGVQDGSGPHVEPLAGPPILDLGAGHLAPGAHQRPCLDVVGGRGAAGHRRLHRRQRHPLGLAQLIVDPHGAAGHAGRVDERVQLQTLAARHDPARRQPEALVVDAGVAVGPDRVGHRQRRTQGQGTPGEMAVGGDTEGERPHQVRRHHGQGPPFADEPPHLRQAEGLQRPQAAVQGLQAVEGRAAAEVAAVDEGDAQAALGGVPGGERAVDPGADDQQIEGLIRQPAHVAHHPQGIVR